MGKGLEEEETSSATVVSITSERSAERRWRGCGCCCCGGGGEGCGFRRHVGVKCVLVLFLSAGVFLSAVFWRPPFLHFADQEDLDLDPRYRVFRLPLSCGSYNSLYFRYFFQIIMDPVPGDNADPANVIPLLNPNHHHVLTDADIQQILQVDENYWDDVHHILGFDHQQNVAAEGYVHDQHAHAADAAAGGHAAGQEHMPPVPVEISLPAELNNLHEQGFLKKSFVQSALRCNSMMQTGVNIRVKINKFIEKMGCALNDLHERLNNSDSGPDTFFNSADTIARLANSVGVTTLLSQALDYQTHCNGRIPDNLILRENFFPMVHSFHEFKQQVENLLKLAEFARYGPDGPPFQPPPPQ